MQTYLVGGAVRDELLGLPVEERDWVVVGATPEELTSQGYKSVGRDFPVFLHPETHEEYALARTERKSAPGHTGFVFHTEPGITLEDDLQRRDLTINAIARDDNGKLIDPYHGQADIEARLLRHVSPAFAEDPLRVLRVARFAARFAPLGFTVAPETLALMRQLVESGELNTLPPERIWQETRKALMSDQPAVYFTSLRNCGALAVLFPELEQLFGVPQPAKHHPEIDCGVHTLLVLAQAVKLSNELPVRFAALVHDLGKGATPASMLPKHHGHEERGVPLVKALSRRLRVPRACQELAVIVSRWHLHCHRALEMKPATILKVLTATDALRRPERFEQFLLACEADARGRTGFEDRAYPQVDYLRQALAAVQAIDTAAIAGQARADKHDIAGAIRKARLAALTRLKPPA